MNRRLYNAISKASEARALFILLVVFVLRARSRLPHLHPANIAIPATLAQAAVFLFAVLHPDESIFIFALGNFIVIALALVPMLARQKALSHVPEP